MPLVNKVVPSSTRFNLIEVCSMIITILSGIMPHCLDPGTVKDVHITPYDGASWA